MADTCEDELVNISSTTVLVEWADWDGTEGSGDVTVSDGGSLSG